MLVRVLGGHTPHEVRQAKLYFIDEIGLHTHLSPTRSNGLLAMLKRIEAYAVASSLIKENYFNITLGVNFNESWFWKSKIR